MNLNCFCAGYPIVSSLIKKKKIQFQPNVYCLGLIIKIMIVTKLVLVICLVLLNVTARAQLYSRETNNNVRYNDSTARSEIFTLYNLVQTGQDFGEVAEKYSQDPGSYKAGGRLQPTTMGEYVDEYRETVLKLSLNEISKPFKSGFGYHIVQLIAKEGSVYTTRHILLRVD